MTEEQIAKIALEVSKHCFSDRSESPRMEGIKKAIRKALDEQPEQPAQQKA